MRRIGPKNTDGGIAEVYLDGEHAATVDTCAAGGKSFQQALFAKSGLTAGDHTLKIVVTGRKNASATAATVVVDAIDVPDESKPPTTGALRLDKVRAERPGDHTVRSPTPTPTPPTGTAFLSVNGQDPVRIAFPTTGGTGTVNVAVARVRLMPGRQGNTLTFSNADGPAPVIDTVAVPQSGD